MRTANSPLSLANIATLRAVPNQVSVDGRTSRAAASMSAWEIIRTCPLVMESRMANSAAVSQMCARSAPE